MHDALRLGDDNVSCSSDGRRGRAASSSTQTALERERQRANRPLRLASRRRFACRQAARRYAPPELLASFLDQRRYLPKGVPLLKRVGQTVCRIQRTILVDGVAIGDALGRDHLGRPLPVWQGCRLIAAGQVFLMNRRSRDSLDGRYFGPLPTTTIVGRADPFWTHEKD